MLCINKCAVPPGSLLDRYSANGCYADCYSIDLEGQVSFPEYVFAFYTTLLFKLERLILKGLVSKPSNDADARKLADGKTAGFAAWHVEARTDDELLLCDFVGRTRSWLMVAPVDATEGHRTLLYFGSAVVPVREPKTGEMSLGFGYRSLLGFHTIYSVLLLYSAASLLRSRVSMTGI
jgi:hypothetical protein